MHRVFRWLSSRLCQPLVSLVPIDPHEQTQPVHGEGRIPLQSPMNVVNGHARLGGGGLSVQVSECVPAMFSGQERQRHH